MLPFAPSNSYKPRWEKVAERINDVCGTQYGISINRGEILYVMARYGPGEGWIVEIGSALGRSTACMAFGSKDAGREKVYAVDPHVMWGTWDRFKDNIANLGLDEWIVPLKMKSEAANREWDGSPIRLLNVDGSHALEDVRNDILRWVPLVVDGGVVVFDDYTNMTGVRTAVDELIEVTGYRVNHYGNMVWFVKEER